MTAPIKLAESQSVHTYVDERIGAFTVPGPHHGESGSQDSFWPTAGAPIADELSRLDIVQHGRLYILADGVSLCADGKEASRIAVETAGNYYYQTTSAYPPTEAGRIQRLEDAVWQAHLSVEAWDERLFCWRAEKHPDGVAHYFRNDQVASEGELAGGSARPICPLCNNPLVGLQTTILAALVRGQHLTIVGVGDCSAFRLPNNPDYGVEWIFTPQDGKFLGMPSLTRQAILGQTFSLSPGDDMLLCSDGMVKVLNGLHSDMGWHQFLRQRLDGDYQANVRETIQDLDGWRLSKPRQRKLHDDLTLVAAGLQPEAVVNRQTERAFQRYDELVAKEQPIEKDFEAFLGSAENALINNDDPKLWQLFGKALHRYGIQRLVAADDWRDPTLVYTLEVAATILRQSDDWVTTARRLAQVSTWANDKSSLDEISSEVHTLLVSDLYSVDFRSDAPNIIEKLCHDFDGIADYLEGYGMSAAASQYRSFINYLGVAQESSGDEKRALPARDEVQVTSSTDEENSQALEMQIQQAIADGKWEIAQELIIELNKLKGATLNLDTEGVDTSPTRPIGVRSPLLQTRMPESQTESNGSRRTELVMPYQQVQRVFHSREPVALVRDAAHAAFSADPDILDPSMAYDLMKEAAKLYPKMGVGKADWETLWNDPNSEFTLLPDGSLPDAMQFGEIAAALKVIRDLGYLTAQSQSASIRNLQKRAAKEELKQLDKWRDDVQRAGLLPYNSGWGAWWYARQLAQARQILPQERDLTTKKIRLSPLDEARLHYTEALWRGMLAQKSADELAEPFAEILFEKLEACAQLEEPPYSDKATELSNALRKPTVISRAFFVEQVANPDHATGDEEARMARLKSHIVAAAWEVTFAMAEGRLPIDREALQAVQTELINAPFDVTQMTGDNGLRLTVIYNLLSLVIHHDDGAIINGFYAYELKVPRQLSEDDFRRLADLRSAVVSAAWTDTLAEAAKKEPYTLPAAGKFVSRVRPDRATPEGRRLQAVRALLPHLSQTYEDWFEYSLFLYQWTPPLELTERDQTQLYTLVEEVVATAWQCALDMIAGRAGVTLSAARIGSLRTLFGDVTWRDDQPRIVTARLRAMQELMPLLLTLMSERATLTKKSAEAQKSFGMVEDELNNADTSALSAACDQPLERLWQFALAAVRGEVDYARIRDEIDQLAQMKTFPGDQDATWEAAEHLLHVANQRGSDKPKYEIVSQELFKAFRTVNIERDANTEFEAKNRQLYELSYFQLTDWKDALPVTPSIWSRRRVNAEKRRIQEYWLLRKEYGM